MEKIKSWLAVSWLGKSKSQRLAANQLISEVRKMEEVLAQIGNFGFPIIVSMYLLIRLEGRMEALTKSIQQLCMVMEKRQ